MKDVSPLTLGFLPKLSFFDVFVGDVADNYFPTPKAAFLPTFVGDDAITPFFGPFSLL